MADDPVRNAPKFSVKAPGTFPIVFDAILDITWIVGDTMCLQLSREAQFGSGVNEIRFVITDEMARGSRLVAPSLQTSLSAGRWYFRGMIMSPEGNSPWSDTVTDELPPYATLGAQVLQQIAETRSLLEELSTVPEQVGHNRPPAEIGLPPYSEADRDDLLEAIASAERHISSNQPANTALKAAASTLQSKAQKFSSWIVKKGDLAVDETIKWAVPVGIGVLILQWPNLIASLKALADNLHRYAEMIASVAG